MVEVVASQMLRLIKNTYKQLSELGLFSAIIEELKQGDKIND